MCIRDRATNAAFGFEKGQILFADFVCFHGGLLGINSGPNVSGGRIPNHRPVSTLPGEVFSGEERGYEVANVAILSAISLTLLKSVNM